jgi:YgiT-type zinc finger domain-containing protein
VVEFVDARRKTMSEYQYADCSFCGGPVVEERVTVIRFIMQRPIILEDVPAGVCQQCGERYFRGAVVEAMERLLDEPAPSNARQIAVPVLEFVAA